MSARFDNLRILTGTANPQLAHDIAPLPDMRGSKNRLLPSSTRAGVLTLSCGIGAAGSRQAWSAAVGAGAWSAAGRVSVDLLVLTKAQSKLASAVAGKRVRCMAGS